MRNTTTIASLALVILTGSVAHGGDGCELPAGGLEEPVEADCNSNGVLDVCEVRDGTSPDCNRNGVPDECDLRPPVRFDRQAWVGRFSGLAGVACVRIGEAAGVVVAGPGETGWQLSLVSAPFERSPAIRNLSLDRAPLRIESGDLDADGLTDVVVLTEVSPRDFAILVTEIRFAGEMSMPREVFRLSSLSGTRVPRLHVADFSGNGRDDVAVLTAARPAVFTLSGSVDAGMTAIETTLDFLPLFSIASDLDRRRGAELAVGDESRVTVYHDPGGGFLTRVVFDDLPGGALVAADLSGDGRPELARLATEGAHLLAVTPEAGATVTRLPMAELPVAGLPATMGLVSSVAWLHADDLDGDGRTELAVAHRFAATHVTSPGELRIYKARPDGFALRTALQIADPGAICVSRVDHDDLLDFVIAGASGLSVVRNQGGLRYQCARGAAGTRADQVEAADLDGDGSVDILLRRQDRLVVLRNLGDGTTLPSATVRSGGISPWSAVLCDHEGDGDLDVYARGSPLSGIVRGSELVWLNDGRGRFRSFVAATDERGRALAAGDLDGDGADEVVLVSQAGSCNVTVVKSDRHGGYFSWRRIPIESCAAEGEVVDLDGGDPEIVLAGNDAVVLCRGLDRAFETVVYPHAPGGAAVRGARLEQLIVDDLDLDGLTDVLIVRTLGAGGGSCLEARFNVGGGRLGALVPLFTSEGGAIENAWTIRSVAGNTPDVLFSLSPGGRPDEGMYRLRQLRGGMFGLPSFLGWRGPAGRLQIMRPVGTVADFDSDGLDDIFLAESSLFPPRTLLNRTVPPREMDRDHDGVPDRCNPRFRRGDSDNNGVVNLADVVRLLRLLFAGGAGSDCSKAADADDDGRLGLTDAVAILDHLFRGGGPLGAPFERCGFDPTVDALPCADFSACVDDA